MSERESEKGGGFNCPPMSNGFRKQSRPGLFAHSDAPSGAFLETQGSSKVQARGEESISRALIGSEVLNQWRFHARPERVPSVPFSDRPSVFAWTKKPMMRRRLARGPISTLHATKTSRSRNRAPTPSPPRASTPRAPRRSRPPAAASRSTTRRTMRAAASAAAPPAARASARVRARRATSTPRTAPPPVRAARRRSSRARSSSPAGTVGTRVRTRRSPPSGTRRSSGTRRI